MASKPLLVQAIRKEIELRHDYLSDKNLKSIYLGGGTPSLLSSNELALILGIIRERFSVASDAEITLEANPDDISFNALKSWLGLGINRLSIGLQSFNETELKWMNRAHTAKESVSSVKMSQDAGFSNLSIDLIYGSRFQSLSLWEKTLECAVSLNTTHISSYNLTIENKTVLGVHHNKGKEPAVNDELSRDQFLMMSEMLQSNGFLHYEISNFGKPGFFAVHNSNYWLRKNYLGVGPSAHSYNGVSREWNVCNNAIYIKALDEGSSFSETEVLSQKDQYNEYVLTRLRTIWGCDISEIRQLFGKDAAANFQKSASKYKNELIEKNGVYTLNTTGRLRADGITSDFFLV
jgi:oxygen-independent coproporphyrinogen-3 oxidase